jgi:hypothetical protein
LLTRTGCTGASFRRLPRLPIRLRWLLKRQW